MHWLVIDRRKRKSLSVARYITFYLTKTYVVELSGNWISLIEHKFIDLFGPIGYKMTEALITWKFTWTMIAFREYPAHVFSNSITSSNRLGMNIAATISLTPDHFTTSRTGMLQTKMQTSCLRFSSVSIITVPFDNSAVLITTVRLDTESFLDWTYS